MEHGRPNRLAREKSPYLLQHAQNPVDWHPWGDDAFERARREDKPVFLSIGYATCHWCHVMAHESFEDDRVAALLNLDFVSVKVDREERPDVDGAYMQVAQMLTGHGGWPLTIVMSPDGKPFYAATYIPKESRWGRPGMLDLLPRIAELWKTERATLMGEADRVLEALQPDRRATGGEAPGEETLALAFAQLSQSFDEKHGGFGRAPKFPTPHNLLFLLHYADQTGDRWAAEMARRTLEAIERGGIHDQVGGGFHRYSTDAEWLLPHFEKMLYDQALLVTALTRAWQVSRAPALERAIRRCVGFVLRDLRLPGGAFASGLDADSEGEEGKHYVWTEAELRDALGADAVAVMRAFGTRPGGNFHDEATRQSTGANVLHRVGGAPPDAALDAALGKLMAARQERVAPALDDKILVDWNGLMIGALSIAGRALDEPSYIAAARTAADFLLKECRTPQGRLLHRWRDGEAAIPAFLDDHAFLAWGLIELYQATLEPRYLEHARHIAQTMVEHFWDDGNGGLFLTAQDAETVLLRQKEAYDGAIPSGNAVALHVLAWLGRALAEAPLEARARQLAAAFGASAMQSPVAHTWLLAGVGFLIGPTTEVVLVGPVGDPELQRMKHLLDGRFGPRTSVLHVDPDRPGPIAKLAPYTAQMKANQGRAVAYACRNQACDRPVETAAELQRILAAQ